LRRPRGIWRNGNGLGSAIVISRGWWTDIARPVIGRGLGLVVGKVRILNLLLGEIPIPGLGHMVL
jgi:hypothetical protein